jgi:hypothetical protein
MRVFDGLSSLKTALVFSEQAESTETRFFRKVKAIEG